MPPKKSSKKPSLESIDKRLSIIEEKINNLPKLADMEKSFISNLLISLAFVLVAVSIPLIVEILGYSGEDLLWIVIPYMVLIFGFMIIAGKILSKK